MTQPNIKFKVITLNSKEDIEKNKKMILEVGNILQSVDLISNTHRFIDKVETHIKLKPRFFLLFDNGELVSVAWGRDDNVFGETFHLSEFGTKKEFQGKKYGTRLMAELASYIFLKKSYKNINEFSKIGSQIVNKRIFEKSKRYDFEEHTHDNKAVKQNIISRKSKVKLK